jgi:hypothetical protein
MLCARLRLRSLDHGSAHKRSHRGGQCRCMI